LKTTEGARDEWFAAVRERLRKDADSPANTRRRDPDLPAAARAAKPKKEADAGS